MPSAGPTLGSLRNCCCLPAHPPIGRLPPSYPFRSLKILWDPPYWWIEPTNDIWVFQGFKVISQEPPAPGFTPSKSVFILLLNVTSGFQHPFFIYCCHCNICTQTHPTVDPKWPPHFLPKPHPSCKALGSHPSSPKKLLHHPGWGHLTLCTCNRPHLERKSSAYFSESAPAALPTASRYMHGGHCSWAMADPPTTVIVRTTDSVPHQSEM